MKLSWILAVCPLFFLGAASTPSAQEEGHEPSVRQLYQFPEGVFLENIAVRSNGHLLLNTFVGKVFSFDPSSEDAAPELVAELPGVSGLTGIAEVAPDVFAISAGDLDQQARRFRGPGKIFLLDLSEGDAAPSVKQIAEFEAGVLNGMAALPRKPHVILSIDSATGQLFRVDTKTGAVDVAFEDRLLGVENSTAPAVLGANGIKILGDQLYFANSVQHLFGRIRICPSGNKAGEAEVLAHLDLEYEGYDDFAITKEGVSYVTVHHDALVKITPDGEQVFVPLGDVPLLDPTAAALSRDERKLYVVTAGPIPVMGGQIVEFTL